MVSKYDYRFREKKKNLWEGRSGVFWISLVCILVFFLTLLTDFFFCSNGQCDVISYLALRPLDIFTGQNIWTLLTHIFMHASLLHLFVNMVAFVSIGRLVENIIGKKRFVWFFVLSGIFAGIVSVLLSGFFGYGFLANVFGSPEVYMVGASGAIFGLAGLITVLLPRLKFSIIFFPFFSLPAYVMVPLVVVLTWLLSIVFVWPIGNVAHTAGFLFGLLYGCYLRNSYPRKIAILQRMFR